MAARKIDQGAALRFNVLERDPNAAHESIGIAVKMNGITVKVLLAAHCKVEGLKGEWFPSIEMAQQIQHHRLQSQSPNRAMVDPAILQARRAAFTALPQLELSFQTRL